MTGTASGAPPVPNRPTLVVISGPPGSGKTTLAHALAGALGCPAICRDEIKEGMARTAPAAVPGPADDLSRRTLPVFFEVLRVLLAAGVTTVAEAAFQHRLWAPGLMPLHRLARLRVVHCTVAAELAADRYQRRHADPLRRVHHGDRTVDPLALRQAQRDFERVRLAVPELAVDTSDGYRPGLAEIIAFATG